MKAVWGELAQRQGRDHVIAENVPCRHCLGEYQMPLALWVADQVFGKEELTS